MLCLPSSFWKRRGRPVGPGNLPKGLPETMLGCLHLSGRGGGQGKDYPPLRGSPRCQESRNGGGEECQLGGQPCNLPCPHRVEGRGPAPKAGSWELWRRSLSTCRGTAASFCACRARGGRHGGRQGAAVGCGAVGWQVLASGMAGKVPGLAARWEKGRRGCPQTPQHAVPGGWSPHWPLLLFPVVTQNGPAGPAWSELAQLCTFQGGAHQGIDARGGGALQGGVWGEQVGDSLAGGWALARAEAGTLPHLCHYRNPEGLLGSQQSCLLVSPFPSGPSTPHRPSCACCPSLAPLPAPAGDLLGPRGAGGRWGWASTPSWFCPSFCRASSKTSPWFTGNVALTPWLMGHTGAKKTPVEGGAGVCCGH